MMELIKNQAYWLFLLALITCSCSERETWIEQGIQTAVQQYDTLSREALERKMLPQSVEDGETKWVNQQAWTSGYFPGSLWFLYELTNDSKWKEKAVKVNHLLDSLNMKATMHDIGLILYCSYGNGLNSVEDPYYTTVLLKGANVLADRFNETTGVIRSWDFGEWQYPVIIDNMMNLELLWWAYQQTGTERFKNIVISHANTTLKNHFRDDYSSFHVVDYDTLTGKAIGKGTFQGTDDTSAWARGQAWGAYGYTCMYRFTGDQQYLAQAEKVISFFFNHPNLPADLIPYWDFDAPNIPNEPRDAAAAAIMASALLELSTLTEDGTLYLEKATSLLKALSAPEYLAPPGTNHHFILKHSTGFKPANREVDAPLNYADYYYLEALTRYQKIKTK